MDLEVSQDQVALCDGIRSLLAGRFTMERVREGFDKAMYNELAEAGVFSLVSDGFVWADAAVVFEQLGAYCVPGPLVACALSGELTTIVETAPSTIEFLGEVDSVIQLGEEIRRAATVNAGGELSSWPLDPLTPITRNAACDFSEVIGSSEDVTTWRRRGAVLTAAYLVGMAARLTEMSVEYAKGREQFDRPIGSFQAIKHLLADMVVRNEVARAAVYAAAAHLDEPNEPGLDLTISVARVLAGEAAIINGKTATQVYGGMGYTWEVDVHLYLKRAWVLDTHFGSIDAHSDLIAAAIAAS